MLNRNLEGNRNYFDNLVDSVGAESRIVFKNQLMVGDTVKFIYKGYAYTGIVASTPRAPFGHYTAKNTRNRLVTMFIFSSPSFKFRWDRFWSALKSLFKIETDIPTLDSRNFRTFLMDNIGNCQRMKPRG